jgi:hypothetical protein
VTAFAHGEPDEADAILAGATPDGAIGERRGRPDSGHSAPALGPVAQDLQLQARQMQALSFTVHIPLVCFGTPSR